MSGHKTKLVVAAIDFGTTFSGYAYSRENDYRKDPLKIYANHKWTDGSLLITLKAPTVVLFDKDGNLDSFGYDAETKYVNLFEEDKHHGWRYFRRFKMKLNENVNIRRNFTLYDDQNNSMPAMKVFTASIKYLKDHLMKRLNESVKGILEEDLHWVLTVPAIWHDGAKQFMIKAAAKAGIQEDKLTLALEPEAAAIFCKEHVVSKANEQGKEAELQSFSPGAQFMVLDLGGGTVDITVHEVESNGSLQELDSPSGGPWGGTIVDSKIELFLDDLFDGKLMKKFRTECKPDDLELQRTIEQKKRQCKVNKGDTITMRVPNALFDFYKKHMRKSFESALESSRFFKYVSMRRDKLQISNDIFLKMFKTSKNKLLSHVDSLLSKPQLRNVKTLIMVGGFSESEVMKNAVKNAFPNKEVIVPEEAELAVLKGAVIFGHNPFSISSRKLRYTYGISTTVPFDERKHPASKKVFRNGLIKCEDVFKVFITAGTAVVPFKTRVEETLLAPYIVASNAQVEVYRSKSESPIYVTDEGCSSIGEIEIQLFGTASKQMVDVIMLFGDTQLHVEAREHGTSNTVSAKFNFLR